MASMVIVWTTSVLAQRPEAPADIRVSEDGQEQTLHCNHNAVHITGNGGRFVIEGTCSTVFIEGSRNWVEVQDAVWIRTSGQLNSVLYLTPGTRVSDSGKGNSVSPKWQQ